MVGEGLHSGKASPAALLSCSDGFPGPATPLLPCNGHASAITEVAEHVVVAGGSVIGKDERPRVGARHPTQREVETASLAEASAAAIARSTAVGPVERDKTASDREARRAIGGGPAVEDAAALAVAAGAAQAAGDNAGIGDRKSTRLNSSHW